MKQQRCKIPFPSQRKDNSFPARRGQTLPLFIVIVLVSSLQDRSFTMKKYCCDAFLHGHGILNKQIVVRRLSIGRYSYVESLKRFHSLKVIQNLSLFSTVSDEGIVASSDYLHNNNKPGQGYIPPRRAIIPPNPEALKIASNDPLQLSLEDALQRKGDNLFEGLKSRPIAGGDWDPENPLGWTKHFGRRSAAKDKEFEVLAHLKPGDVGYFDVSSIKVEGVTIVRNKDEAKIVVERLMNADTSIVHACDTEVMGIDLGNVGPVGNGYVTCVSIYSGPQFDYGLGEKPGSVLWIDNLDDSYGLLQLFKSWFEDKRFLKVWHNYGFDRHVMWNEGIDVKGFGGDTMHMARLQDTGRAKYGTGRGFSLEALTDELLERRKAPMKEIFGVPRLRKDGTPGSIIDLPPVEVMQRDPQFRVDWIRYSAYDAEGTWLLREKLQGLLEAMPWTLGENLYYYYFHYLREFGEVLTDMERRGIRVDAKDYLASVEVQARKDREHHVAEFRKWAAQQIGPDGLALNPASSLQLNIFLFGGSKNAKTGEPTESVRTLQIPRDEVPEEAVKALKERDEQQLKSGQGDEESEYNLKRVILFILIFLLPLDTPDSFDLMTAEQLKALCKGW